MKHSDEEERISKVITILNGLRRPLVHRMKELEESLQMYGLNMITADFYRLQLQHVRAEVDYLNNLIESQTWRA